MKGTEWISGIRVMMKKKMKMIDTGGEVIVAKWVFA